jgi:hypothetical protein
MAKEPYKAENVMCSILNTTYIPYIDVMFQQNLYFLHYNSDTLENLIFSAK